MFISNELQRINIELDGLDKVTELLVLGLQQPEATIEHAISSIFILRLQIKGIGEELDNILDAEEKEEDNNDGRRGEAETSTH